MLGELFRSFGLGSMLSVFLESLVMVFLAELGDKSQLAAMGLTTKYKLRDIVLGVVGASLVANFVAISFGSMLGTYVFLGYIKIALSLGFLVAGIVSILDIKKQGKKAENRTYSQYILPLSFAITFVMSEIGDKSQIETVLLSAEHIPELLGVYLGSALGMILGALVWIPVMKHLIKTLPKEKSRYFPFTMYSAFGFYNLFLAVQNVGLSQGMQLILLGGTAVGFAMLSTLLIENNERRF